MSSTRRIVRTLIIQALFETDFHGAMFDEKRIGDIFNRLAEENAPQHVNNDYANVLIKGIVAKKKEIDAILENVAADWPLEKMGIVDRNILRLGVFELLFGDTFDVPGRVAINEAIDLAKIFVGDHAGKFVSGVLGGVYREIGGDTEERKERRVKQSVGAMIYRIDKDKGPLFVFVHDIFHKWTLPKGSIEHNEDKVEALRGIMKKELGLDTAIEDEVGTNSYVSHLPEGPIRKEVTYFLAKTDNQTIQLEDKEGIDEAKWFTANEASGLPLYSDIKPMIFDAIEKVEKERKAPTSV